jgi:hypothetical protein
MEIMFEGVPLIVAMNGTIQIYKNQVMQRDEGIMDVDGSLKICIHNKYYKIQDIVAMAYMDYNPRDRVRIVTHINKNKTDNRIDNLCIENLELKRKFDRMSI